MTPPKGRVSHMRCSMMTSDGDVAWSFSACTGRRPRRYAKKDECPTCPACCVIWDIMKDEDLPGSKVEAVPMEFRALWPRWPGEKREPA